MHSSNIRGWNAVKNQNSWRIGIWFNFKLFCYRDLYLHRIQKLTLITDLVWNIWLLQNILPLFYLISESMDCPKAWHTVIWKVLLGGGAGQSCVWSSIFCQGNFWAMSKIKRLFSPDAFPKLNVRLAQELVNPWDKVVRNLFHTVWIYTLLQ